MKYLVIPIFLCYIQNVLAVNAKKPPKNETKATKLIKEDVTHWTIFYTDTDDNEPNKWFKPRDFEKGIFQEVFPLLYEVMGLNEEWKHLTEKKPKYVTYGMWETDFAMFFEAKDRHGVYVYPVIQLLRASDIFEDRRGMRVAAILEEKPA